MVVKAKAKNNVFVNGHEKHSHLRFDGLMDW